MDEPRNVRLVEKDRAPSALSVLLAIIAERHHDVELEWTAREVGENDWQLVATFGGALHEGDLSDLVSWSERFEGAWFRVGAYGNVQASCIGRVLA
jgi:hypothetical protein